MKFIKRQEGRSLLGLLFLLFIHLFESSIAIFLLFIHLFESSIAIFLFFLYHFMREGRVIFWSK
ncbi:hypothetical protein CUN40_09770 [Enterococcus faecium]|nr:hypothetical protein CUN40_09770 [Enterococcus faecium]